FHVLAYCVRCWRGRLGAWFATAAAIGGVLSLAAAAELFLVLSERSLSEQVRAASEFQVFLADTAGADQVDALRGQIAALPGVRHAPNRRQGRPLPRRRPTTPLPPTPNNTEETPFPASLAVDLSPPPPAEQVTNLATHAPATARDVPSSYPPAEGRH